MRRGVVRWSAVLLLSSLVCAAAQDDADGAAVSVDEGEEESSTNSNIAKAVEQWLPLFLGLVLILAVLGWCALNVYRASKAQDAEEALAAAEAGKGGAKVPGSTSISAAPSRHSSMRQPSLRHPSYRLSGERGGTGDVSPEVDYAIEPKRSLRGSGVTGGHQHGALAGANRADLIPALLFKGDELQGKKAPGEQGDVYQNPMQRRPRARGVSTPDTSDATTHSSGSISGRNVPPPTSDDDDEMIEIAGFNAMELGQRSSSSSQRGTTNPLSSSSSAANTTSRKSGKPGEARRGRGDGNRTTEKSKTMVPEGASSRNISSSSSSRRKDGGNGRRGGDGKGGMASGGGRAGSGGMGGDGPEGEGRSYSQADFARSLPPAVLRSARPIPRNASSSGVERGSVAH